MRDEIIIGFIEVFSTCITQIIIHIISKFVDTRAKKDDNIAIYIEPLKRQLAEV